MVSKMDNSYYEKYALLEHVYGFDTIDLYKMMEQSIAEFPWDEEQGLSVQYIAFYLYLHHDDNMYEILHNKGLSKKREASIIRNIEKVFSKIISYRNNDIELELFRHREERLRQQLKEFAPYFMRNYGKKEVLDCIDEDDDWYSKELIKGTNKKYPKHQAGYIQNCIDGTLDEIMVLVNFFDGIRDMKQEIKKQGVRAKECTKRGYSQNKGLDMKYKEFCDGFKRVLAKMLADINTPEIKIQRLTATAITAITKEIVDK